MKVDASKHSLGHVQTTVLMFTPERSQLDERNSLIGRMLKRRYRAHTCRSSILSRTFPCRQISIHGFINEINQSTLILIQALVRKENVPCSLHLLSLCWILKVHIENTTISHLEALWDIRCSLQMMELQLWNSKKSKMYLKNSTSSDHLNNPQNSPCDLPGRNDWSSKVNPGLYFCVAAMPSHPTPSRRFQSGASVLTCAERFSTETTGVTFSGESPHRKTQHSSII